MQPSSCTWEVSVQHQWHSYLHFWRQLIFAYSYLHIPSSNQYMHTYIPTYLHTFITTYLHTYIPSYIPTDRRTYIHAYYIHTLYIIRNTHYQIHAHTFTNRITIIIKSTIHKHERNHTNRRAHRQATTCHSINRSISWSINQSISKQINQSRLSWWSRAKG